MLGEIDRSRWLNASRCACDATLTVELNFAAGGGEVVLAAGKGCAGSESGISTSCTVLWRRSGDTVDSVEEVAVSASEIAGSCGAAEKELDLEVLFDETGEDRWILLGEITLGVDTKPPAAPEAIDLLPGEGLVEVVYRDDATGRAAEERKYQVLCARADGTPAITEPPDAAFDAPADRCGTTSSTLSAARVCAEATSDPDSATVLGLENGRRYRFWVVSIDGAGNASAPVEVGTTVPAPEEDFWERYQRSGGAAPGGECALAAAYAAGHPDLVVLRALRDRVLARSAPGRRVIAAYRALSARLAPAVAAEPKLAALVRAVARPIAGALRAAKERR